MAKYCGVISGYYIRQYTHKDGSVSQFGGDWHPEKDVYGDTWAEIEEQASEYAKEDGEKKSVQLWIGNLRAGDRTSVGGFDVSSNGKVYNRYEY